MVQYPRSVCFRLPLAILLKHTNIPKLRKRSSVKYVDVMQRDPFSSQASGYLQEAYSVSVWGTALWPRSCFGRTLSELWQILHRSRLAEGTSGSSLYLCSSHLSSGYQEARVLREKEKMTFIYSCICLSRYLDVSLPRHSSTSAFFRHWFGLFFVFLWNKIMD